jgi:hypothetical protein
MKLIGQADTGRDKVVNRSCKDRWRHAVQMQLLFLIHRFCLVLFNQLGGLELSLLLEIGLAEEKEVMRNAVF